MITLRKDLERRHIRRHMQEFWLSFYPQSEPDSLAEGFSALETLNEERLPPGAGITLRPRHDAEIVTYVREGTLTHEDSKGRSGVMHAGEFRRVRATKGLRYTDTNSSRTDWAHVFQIWLYPSEHDRDHDHAQAHGHEHDQSHGHEHDQAHGPALDQAYDHDYAHDQKSFCAADRQGFLCVVASPDGRNGSLRVRQDAVIYSALLAPGQRLTHALPPGRSAWLHLVRGQATLGKLVLTTGDGVGVSAERVVSIGATEETEFLLLELPALPVVPSHDGFPSDARPLDQPRRMVTAPLRRAE